MRLQIRRTVLGVAGVLVLVIGVALPLQAHNGQPEDVRSEQEIYRPATISQNGEVRTQGKLDDARHRICNKRLASIQRIMTRASTQGQKHLAVFNTISTKGQEFYTAKQLNVPNYADLIVKVGDKKTAAEAAIAAIKDHTPFDCKSDDPVGKTNSFISKVRTMHQALHDYRLAIKDLFAAIKSAARSSEEAGT